ncbi:dCTP deaminase domain-containing protein [Streptomyces klenkii]|uniref:dCTP deaminase domain-containing protein n=1 Tax=Streptomyces klenkii TaxID=1420899 RepID=UPI003F4C20C0
MILTSPEITAAALNGRLRIDPFDPEQVNPNNYDVRLGRHRVKRHSLRGTR